MRDVAARDRVEVARIDGKPLIAGRDRPAWFALYPALHPRRVRGPVVAVADRSRIRTIAWRRAQRVMHAEFRRQTEALLASLAEHVDAGRGTEAFFASLEDKS